MTGRVVGLDFGSRRIGVAVCDDDGRVATPYETIARRGDETIEHGRIAEIVAETGAQAVVVGHPLELDGREGRAAVLIGSEARRLAAKIGVPVHLHDERLTTVSAERSLIEQGVRRRDRKAVIDQLAAATILQSWLDHHSG